MRRVLAFFMSLLMVVSVFISAAAAAVNDASSSQSENTVHEIKTEADLKGLAEQVISGVDFKGHEFHLKNDIEIEGLSIGRLLSVDGKTVIRPFNGIFDGENHAITYKNCTEAVETPILFGYIGADGEVKNLKIGSSSDRRYRQAGIAAHNFGKVTDCCVRCKVGCEKAVVLTLQNGIKATGTAGVARINGGIIDGCTVEGMVWCSSQAACGITCCNFGEIKNCKVKNAVCSENNNAGGIADTNIGKIENCYIEDSVFSNSYNLISVAGIAITNAGHIKHCCVKGKVYSRMRKATLAYTNTENGIVEDCQVSSWYNRLSFGDYAYRTTPVTYFVFTNNGVCSKCKTFLIWPW